MNIYKPKIDRTAKKVGVFCNARDEKNIKEWAAHYLLLGFDVVVIYDHKSIYPLKEEFRNFDKRVIIIRVEFDDVNVKQILMNNAINVAKNLNLDWYIYLDADEFLVLHHFFKGIKQFLTLYSYGDSIAINWLMFGSNNLVEEPQGLILENYILSCNEIDKHVKSFVRPNEIVKSNNPHYYEIRNPNKMIGLNFKPLHRPYCFNNLSIPFYKAPAYIAHYVYQSEETYVKRKINLKGDDGSTRPNMGKEIHNHYNDVINMQPQKYINQIKQFLTYYNTNR